MPKRNKGDWRVGDQNRRIKIASDPTYAAKVLARKRANAAKRYAQNKERELAKSRDRRFALLVRKAGRPPNEGCDVCKLAFEPRQAGRTNLSRRPFWDHDHTTGRFRGWLCGSCNTALGHAKDSPELLRKLADYLEAK